MSPALVCLTLRMPMALEDDFTDFVLAWPEGIEEVTVMPAQAMGGQVVLGSNIEKVRGRAMRSLLQVVLRQDQADRLIEALRRDLPGAPRGLVDDPGAGCGEPGMRAAAMLGVVLLPMRLMAAEPVVAAATPDLPPQEQVARALAAHPQVQAARDLLRAQQGASRVLRAGTHEFILRLEGAQRRDRLVDQRYHEWNAVLERTLRLPEKARLDDRLGQEGLEQAGILIGDALHENGRNLLRLWFNWMRAASLEQVQQEQGRVTRELLVQTTKRLRAGDAPRQEQILAEAALAQAEFVARQAALAHPDGAHRVAAKLSRAQPAPHPGDSRPGASRTRRGRLGTGGVGQQPRIEAGAGRGSAPRPVGLAKPG